MGRVWAARLAGRRQLPKLFAVKTALVEGQATAEFGRQFLDEAKISCRIEHPNVCRVHAFDEHEGIHYLVMDWSDGGSLRDWLDSAPEHRIPYALAARIAACVADGLHAAHQLVDDEGHPMDVVHRDVSPQNILLSSSGLVRLTDFGIAKARGQLHRPTQTGEVKGKLSYMAPEQVTSRELDRRVDVFALGCVLYEATVGHRPFFGEDALSTLYRLLETELVPPSHVRADYPPALEAILNKALAKDRDLRYPTAAAFSAALGEYLSTAGERATETEIACSLDGVLGDAIRQRRERLRAAIERLDTPAVSSLKSTLRSELVATESTERSVVDATGAAPAAPGRPGRVGWRWLAVGGSAVVLAGAGLWWARGAARVSGPPQAQVAGPSLPQSPGSSAVSIGVQSANLLELTLHAEPESAVFRIDDGPALSNPYRGPVPRDGKVHQITAQAAGYGTASKMLTFDGDQTLSFTLSKVGRPGESRATATRTAAATPVPAATGTGTVRPQRTVTRVLDEDNPFAGGRR